ncbi:hypothetical protein H6P81_016045 [Aristolochia fimbriata]|uniref:Uncharacterized protein n=1 Tax=Aristolochia fimbriata TaxID=158543 RepID=A0AAV7E775_ARIFI|nr:hypothetical protein H6P81_016045 [Aristolochia fimbriata]
MPRRATGAGPVRKRPSINLSSLLGPGADGEAPPPATVKGTPAQGHARRSPPPRGSAAAPPLGGWGGSGAQQIVALPPRARLAENTLPQGHFGTTSGGPAPPGPLRGLKSVRGPGSRGPLPAVASADREALLGLAPQKLPFKDGPGASPMEWGPERVTAPQFGPRQDREALSAKSGKRMGVGRCASVRARDGESRSAADWAPTDAGHGRPSPADDPRPRIRRLADRGGGWRDDHGRVPSWHLRRLAPGQLVPHSTRLETRTKESDMCAKSAGHQTPEGARKLIGGISSWLHRRPT